MKRLAAAFAASGLMATAVAAHGAMVTVIYEAEAVTVAQNPFGLSIPLDTPVSGYFTFDLDTPDSEPDDPLEGAYQHAGNAGFLARFLDTRITGSTTPFYQVDLTANPTIDTFRIYDGPRPVGNEGGVMSIDDVADEDITLLLAVTGDVFDSDALINPFPGYDFGFLGTPHTFYLKDDQGTMLLQFTKVFEATCGDSSDDGVKAGDALHVLRAAVGSGSCLPCLCDVDASGAVTALDALSTLRFSVSGSPALTCPSCL